MSIGDSPRKAWSLAVLALVALLAGCIGGEEEVTPAEEQVAEEAEEARVTDEFGSVSGTVASELFEPLGGADVTLVETGAATKVARTGKFTINDVEPGSYTLFITDVGYQSHSRPIQVQAGQVTEVSVHLVPLPSDDPYVNAYEVKSSIGIGARWQVEPPTGCIIIPTPALLDIKSCGGIGGGQQPAVNITEDVMTHLVELAWQPAGPLGENLQLDYMCPDVPRGNGGAVLDDQHPCYFEAPGSKSPLAIRVDLDHQLDNGYAWAGDWAARTFGNYGTLGTYDLTGVDAGIAYQQSFTYYISVFHKEPAPEGYTGIPDA